jgi:hypothetical protein
MLYPTELWPLEIGRVGVNGEHSPQINVDRVLKSRLTTQTQCDPTFSRCNHTRIRKPAQTL